MHRAFGIRVAYSRHHGKVYAGWAAPECPSIDTYCQVIDAVERAVEDKVEEIVRNAHNKANKTLHPWDPLSRAPGFSTRRRTAFLLGGIFNPRKENYDAIADHWKVN